MDASSEARRGASTGLARWRNPSRSDIPARMSVKGKALTCAAASSTPSGSPSVSAQIASTHSASQLTAAGCAKWARSRNKVTASAPRPPTGNTTSPGRPSATRLVASTRSVGQRRNNWLASPATVSRRCSQVSRTSRVEDELNRWNSCSTGSTPGSSRSPHARHTVTASNDGLSSGPRSTNPPTSRFSLVTQCTASRVLPAPPGPTSVTSRCLPTNNVSAASSRCRPTNDDTGAGGSTRRTAWVSRRRVADQDRVRAFGHDGSSYGGGPKSPAPRMSGAGRFRSAHGSRGSDPTAAGLSTCRRRSSSCCPCSHGPGSRSG